jgi:hypothetical protein
MATRDHKRFLHGAAMFVMPTLARVLHRNPRASVLRGKKEQQDASSQYPLQGRDPAFDESHVGIDT